MKSDNKKALYESIMTSVAREVKKVLNEGKYPEVYTNDLGQEIYKPSDPKYEIEEIGENIAKILMENISERQLQVMQDAIVYGTYARQGVSPIDAINAILFPLYHYSLDIYDLEKKSGYRR